MSLNHVTLYRTFNEVPFGDSDEVCVQCKQPRGYHSTHEQNVGKGAPYGIWCRGTDGHSWDYTRTFLSADAGARTPVAAAPVSIPAGEKFVVPLVKETPTRKTFKTVRA